MAEASLFPLVEISINDSYGLSYRNQSCKEIDGLSGKTENVGVSERWAKIHHHMVAVPEHL